MEERNGADLDRGGVVADDPRGVHADALRDLRDDQTVAPRDLRGDQTVALHDRGGVVADDLHGVHAHALHDLRDDQTVALRDLRDVQSDVLQVRVRLRIHVDDLQVPHGAVRVCCDHQTSINR